MAVNASYASPTADARFASVEPGSAGALLAALVGRVNGWSIAITLFLALVVYDQVKYILNKGSIAGPLMKAPFIGPFLQSMNPEFDGYYRQWMSGPLSCVSVFHKFVVIASTRDISRKIFNSPNFVKPCVVDIAHKILRPNNWVFLDGKAHVDYRKGLNGLFTRQALEVYLPGQDEVYTKFFKDFVQLTENNKGKHVEFMTMFREIMCAVSLRTFVGHYLPEEAIKKIANDYYLITAALELVNFPIIIPFTKSWYGKKAADMVLGEFSKCAAKSKVRMEAGGEPDCILDYWVRSMFECENYRQMEAKGEVCDKPSMMIRMFSDFEISMTLFTFLFASQDASSSATTWLFQIMADQSHILDKIREENLRVRGGDRNMPISMNLLDNMTYTRAAVKECLRYRPPVIMVPYVAKKAFPVTETYTAPKGSMVIPSTWFSLHDPEAYPDPDTYNPDRWITGDAEKQSKNWLVFGTGPHYCIGQVYVMNNLMLMIGKASMFMDWDHKVTPRSEKIEVFATIFPQDHCLLTFKDRPEN